MNNYYQKWTASKGLVYKTWWYNPKGDRVLAGDKNQVYKGKQTRNKIELNIGPWRCMTILVLQSGS